MNMAGFDYPYVSEEIARTVVKAIAAAPYGFAIWQSESPDVYRSDLILRFINIKGASPSGKHPKDLVDKKMADCMPELIGTSLDLAIREAMVHQIETEVVARSIPVPGGDERVFRNEIAPVSTGLVMSTFVEVTKESILERDYRTERRTGLATRAYFDDVALQTFEEQKATSESFGILFMDLDKFKSINDMYGHICGDEVLTEVARRLRLIQPQPRLISHWGGDEFAMVNTWSEDENAKYAQSILSAFSTPFLWGRESITLKVSVGYLTKRPTEKMKVRDMLSLVDSAMYRAKQNGGNRCENAELLDRDEIIT